MKLLILFTLLFSISSWANQDDNPPPDVTCNATDNSNREARTDEQGDDPPAPREDVNAGAES